MAGSGNKNIEPAAFDSYGIREVVCMKRKKKKTQCLNKSLSEMTRHK